MKLRLCLFVSTVIIGALALTGCVSDATGYASSLPALSGGRSLAKVDHESEDATGAPDSVTPASSASSSVTALAVCTPKKSSPLPAPSSSSGSRGSAGLSEAERIRRAKAAKKAAWEAAEEQWRKNKAELDAWRASQGDDY